MIWLHDNMDDYDYYKLNDDLDDDELIIYDRNKEERMDEFDIDNNIVGIDYNAVAIYPNNIKAKYNNQNVFMNYKKKLTRHKHIHGKCVNTDKLEIEYINDIINFYTCIVPINEYLTIL